MVNNKEHNILGIDWGSKYIGLAHTSRKSEIVFPIGYILNDGEIFFKLAEIIQKYNIETIVLGRPMRQKDIQEKIERFIKNLNYIIDTTAINIEKVGEDYTSVQAGEIVSNFKKNVAEDTISAMLILERWKNSE